MVDTVRAVVRAVNKLTERAIVKLTLDVTANLREVTPRDTGWAAANWVPSIGKPVVADLGGIQPTAALATSAAAEQATAIAGVLGYKLSRGRVFVTNNVDYITELNDGKSKKEPAGFVQRAIRKAVTQDIKGLR